MKNLSYFGTVNPKSKKCYNLKAPKTMTLTSIAARDRICPRLQAA